MNIEKKPRMLFISAENPFPQDSGGKLRTGNILKVLLGNYHVDLITYSHNDQSERMLQKDAMTIHEVRKTITFRKAKIRSLYKWRNCSYMSHVDVDFNVKIQRLCSQHKYDKVFISHSLLGCCLKLVKKLLPSTKIITDAHNFELGLSNQLASSKKGMIRFYFKLNSFFTKRDEMQVLKDTNLLFTTSEDDASAFKQLMSRYAHKIHVIPNFIDIKSYKLSNNSVKEDFIILPGNMNYFPNVNGALYFYNKIYGEIKTLIPDIKWYIVGRDVHPSIAKLAEKDSSIIVTGYVESVMDYLQRAKVVVAPLLEGSGTRLKILEAWAARTPVVSTNKGAEGLSCEHGKNIFIADDPSGFSSYVVNLINDSGLNKKVADNAYRNLITRYERETVSGKILQLV